MIIGLMEDIIKKYQAPTARNKNRSMVKNIETAICLWCAFGPLKSGILRDAIKRIVYKLPKKNPAPIESRIFLNEVIIFYAAIAGVANFLMPLYCQYSLTIAEDPAIITKP